MKLLVSTIDELFKYFEIEPGLPDPKYYPSDTYLVPNRRVLPPGMEVTPASAEKDRTATEYRRVKGRHPVTQQTIYFWRRVE